jgi:hypothetical protein
MRHTIVVSTVTHMECAPSSTAFRMCCSALALSYQPRWACLSQIEPEACTFITYRSECMYSCHPIFCPFSAAASTSSSDFEATCERTWKAPCAAAPFVTTNSPCSSTFRPSDGARDSHLAARDRSWPWATHRMGRNSPHRGLSLKCPRPLPHALPLDGRIPCRTPMRYSAWLRVRPHAIRLLA